MMVLEVLADAGQVVDDRDPEGSQLLGVADARQLEELGRVDRAAGEDHLAPKARFGPRPPAAVFDTHGAGPLEAGSG